MSEGYNMSRKCRSDVYPVLDKSQNAELPINEKIEVKLVRIKVGLARTLYRT